MDSSADPSSTATAAPIRPRAELITEFRLRMLQNEVEMVAAHRLVGLRILQMKNLARLAFDRLVSLDPAAAESVAVADASRVQLSNALAKLDMATDEHADLLPWDAGGVPDDLTAALARVLHSEET